MVSPSSEYFRRVLISNIWMNIPGVLCFSRMFWTSSPQTALRDEAKKCRRTCCSSWRTATVRPTSKPEGAKMPLSRCCYAELEISNIIQSPFSLLCPFFRDLNTFGFSMCHSSMPNSWDRCRERGQELTTKNREALLQEKQRCEENSTACRAVEKRVQDRGLAASGVWALSALIILFYIIFDIWVKSGAVDGCMYQSVACWSQLGILQWYSTCNVPWP